MTTWRSPGESDWIARLVPLTVDGLIYARPLRAFAGEVAAGRVPSVRTIRTRLHVGQLRAQCVRAYLTALVVA